eukprot:3927113-Rhodomonas_salina.1
MIRSLVDALLQGGTQVSAAAVSAMLPHAVKQQLGSGDMLANVLSMIHISSGQPSNFNCIPAIYPQGDMVNSLGSGRTLLSRPTNLPGMGFNAVNVCNKVNQITKATTGVTPGKSPLSPRVPTTDARTTQSSSAEDDWMEFRMHTMVAERSWVGATVC